MGREDVKAVLLDTHAWAWSIKLDPRFSRTAVTAIADAEIVYVSAISVYEIGQKVTFGKWPDMGDALADLPSLLRGRSGMEVPLTADVALAASRLAWDHRDPFDRFIASTAIHMGVPLVSADAAFDQLSASGLRRIW